MTRKLLSKKQFADKINRSVRHVERLIETGQGPPVVHVGVRAVAIDEDDADRWIEARRQIPPGWVDTGAGERRHRRGRLARARRSLKQLLATPGQESAGTILRAAFFGWTMLACYFPQGEAKGRYFDVCCDVARACSGHPLLVLGDLNTGNQLADKTLGGVNYACADKFDRLSSTAGLIDLWRLTNGTHAREWTWRTPKNGFRIDHAFGNGEFLERYRPGGHYDHAPREARFSDHSALLVTMIETHSP